LLLLASCTPAAVPPTPPPPDPECTRELQDERRRAEKERDSAELRLLQAAVEEDTKNAEHWAKLGHAYGDRSDNALAVDAFEHATRLAPEVAQYWRALGKYRLYQDDEAQVQTAPVAFRTCLEKAPTLVVCWWSLGNAYRQIGDLPAARDALRRALELGQNCQLDLASVQLVLGDIDAADALVRAGIENERAPRDSSDVLYSYLSLGLRIAERRGDAAAIAAVRQQLAEATPRLSPDYAFNLGSTLAVMRPPEVERARRLLTSFVRNTCDKPNHGHDCDRCATARDLLDKLRERRDD
jgi:Tfp pilus assembly protein PilF